MILMLKKKNQSQNWIKCDYKIEFKKEVHKGKMV